MRRLFALPGLGYFTGTPAPVAFDRGPRREPSRPLFRQVLARSYAKDAEGKWRVVRDWNRYPWPEPVTDYQ